MFKSEQWRPNVLATAASKPWVLEQIKAKDGLNIRRTAYFGILTWTAAFIGAIFSVFQMPKPHIKIRQNLSDDQMKIVRLVCSMYSCSKST